MCVEGKTALLDFPNNRMNSMDGENFKSNFEVWRGLGKFLKVKRMENNSL